MPTTSDSVGSSTRKSSHRPGLEEDGLSSITSQPSQQGTVLVDTRTVDSSTCLDEDSKQQQEDDSADKSKSRKVSKDEKKTRRQRRIPEQEELSMLESDDESSPSQVPGAVPMGGMNQHQHTDLSSLAGNTTVNGDVAAGETLVPVTWPQMSTN